ncbi:MAG: thioredoxin domain-containing protein [Terriglobales bacterium]|jgi:protein-disulfide isomerase
MRIQRWAQRLILPNLGLTSRAFVYLALLTLPIFAQDVPEVLRPPKGAQLALVVFEDLQCPQCARVAPLLVQAARNYKIPLVQHDFPLQGHNWSFEAAVLARYFDTHSKETGNSFRESVFEHHLEINPQNLRGFAEKFAAEHNIRLPFAVDPDGKLAGLVKADRELGDGLHLVHTPTIYVVSNKSAGEPYVEVTDTNQLYALIDAMKSAPADNPAKAPVAQSRRDPGNEEIRQEIQKIRQGPHNAMPPTQKSKMALRGQSGMRVENGTKYTVTVFLSGPATQELKIPPKSTRGMRILPGKYEVAARVSYPSAIPYYNELEYPPNTQTLQHFFITAKQR